MPKIGLGSLAPTEFGPQYHGNCATFGDAVITRIRILFLVRSTPVMVVQHNKSILAISTFWSMIHIIKRHGENPAAKLTVLGERDHSQHLTVL